MTTLTHIEFQAGGRRWCADLSRPLNIAIALEFDGAQPSFYGAQPATAVPLHSGSFVGDVLKGGSCRCSTYTLTPHCNGTHTESIGHVVHESVSVHATANEAFLVARVVSVAPSVAEEGTAEPAVQGDRIITATQLQSALEDQATADYRALVVRTLPNTADKTTRSYSLDAGMPPYFSTDAVRWIVERGVDHLVVDLPSIDRAVDGGLLRGHRIFWGLPGSSTRLSHATRPHATITELAYVDNAIADGLYLLNLQLPAFESDAAPSRPILYPIEPATS